MSGSEMANVQSCIAACPEALRACQACVAGDLRDGSIDCIPVNLDCADICAATLNALARGSAHHGDFCALCAHVCRACAAKCAQHAAMHKHCSECQAACERCAAECDKHAREKHI